VAAAAAGGPAGGVLAAGRCRSPSGGRPAGKNGPSMDDEAQGPRLLVLVGVSC